MQTDPARDNPRINIRIYLDPSTAGQERRRSGDQMSLIEAPRHRVSGNPLSGVSGQKELKYLLVHDWLPSLGGSENVFQEICSLFPGQLVSSLVKKELFPWIEGRALKTSPFQKLPFAFWKHYIFSPWMPGFYRKVDTSGYDVLLVDSHSFAHHIRAEKGKAYLCYYHTSARSLWNPEIDNRASKGRLKWVRNVVANRLRRLDLEASKNPTYLIANSQTTADRIEKNYCRKVDEVIYPPVEVEKWLDTPRLDKSEGFLMWGRLIGYKRIDIAIEAAKSSGHRLNIVGAGPLASSLKESAANFENIRFHGRLEDSELKKLIARSVALLFPGYEDFGIVPVEAMAAGLPVIALGQGGAAETVSGHGLLLSSYDPAELAEKMDQILGMGFDPESLKAHARQYDAQIFRTRYRAAVQKAIDKTSKS